MAWTSLLRSNHHRSRAKSFALSATGFVAGAALVRAFGRHRKRMAFDGRVALITGGSRGLGLLVARELGRRGCRVVLAARNEDELERARGGLSQRGIEVSVLVSDVSRAYDAEHVVRTVIEQHGRLDILVNNAGIMTVGPQDHMTEHDFKEAMDVHFWGPLQTMRAAIPHMRDQGAGRIVNISSIGGKIAVPHLAPYCASKFALTGLSTALRAELARDGILVTTVCPGLMRTGSPFNAWFKGRYREEFTWFAISGSAPLVTASAERAATQIVDAARDGDAELVITLSAKLAIVMNALLPNAIATAMTIANALLPSRTDEVGDQPHSGWQSSSRWAPSVLTRSNERAAIRNNELPQPPIQS